MKGGGQEVGARCGLRYRPQTSWCADPADASQVPISFPKPCGA